MTKPVIYSTHGLHRDALALIGDAARVVTASGLDADTLAREGRGADIVIVRAPLPEAMFAPGTKLRATIRHGAGVDMIPLAAATAAGVLVANVPGANAPTVAEHVMFAALGLLRKFRLADGDLRHAGWLAGRAHAEEGHDLAGKTVGLVGMGAVGRAVVRLAQAFGCTVVGYSPSGRNFPAGARLLPLDAVVAESDILVLCCPLKPETRGLIDQRRFGLMKRGSLFINVARGPVADEAALVAALRSGALGGAALDVFDTQPLPPDHPLFSFGNVILTPHMAGITDESMARMGMGAVGEALRVLAGELPLNLVNPEALAAYGARIF